MKTITESDLFVYHKFNLKRFAKYNRRRRKNEIIFKKHFEHGAFFGKYPLSIDEERRIKMFIGDAKRMFRRKDRVYINITIESSTQDGDNFMRNLATIVMKFTAIKKPRIIKSVVINLK